MSDAVAAAKGASTNKLAFKLEAKEEYVFSADLQRILVEVIASKDPLDQPDFSPVDYINGLFPDGAVICLARDLLHTTFCFCPLPFK